MKCLIILIFYLILSSCNTYSICNTEAVAMAEKVRCETNSECIEKFDETYICKSDYDYYKKKSDDGCAIIVTPKGDYCVTKSIEKQCVKDLCSFGNVDCGFGICELNIPIIGESEYSCNCDYGYLKKHFESGDETCILNSCFSSADCLNTEIVDGYSFPTPICSPEGKCVEQ